MRSHNQARSLISLKNILILKNRFLLIRAASDRAAGFGTDLVNIIEGYAGNVGSIW